MLIAPNASEGTRVAETGVTEMMRYICVGLFVGVCMTAWK